MNVKTSELADEALNWAVAKCEGWIDECNSWMYQVGVEDVRDGSYHPSTDWAQGGPIIERERIQVFPHNGATEWCGVTHVQRDGYIAILTQDGPTPLIAAMRCYCCATLGDEVDIPQELQPCQQPNL